MSEAGAIKTNIRMFSQIIRYVPTPAESENTGKVYRANNLRTISIVLGTEPTMYCRPTY